ncbi:cupin domain-containing protein [Arthrobacter rhombi]|uniref:(R)-mandelonitrile lyase n=1 Tax=Arthrobacter rhombi TaxID=71253 RepID=UPI0031DFA942
MELHPAKSASKGPPERFTGDVWVEMVASPPPSGTTAGFVRFAPGSRTAWHVHTQGQTLHITEGAAIVQTRDGEALLARVGDTVYTPPGQWHWHGATTVQPMTHLALSESVPDEKGPAVIWGEHVTDADYQRANAKSV